MHRPHYTHKDENHNIVLDFMKFFCGGFEIAPAEARNKTLAYTANYRGYKFIAYDTANFGGVFPDWILECVQTCQVRWIEVKTEKAYNAPNHSLKAGEFWLRENSALFAIAVTDEGLQAIFDDMIKP